MKVFQFILIFSIVLLGCKSTKKTNKELETLQLELQVIQETLPDYLDSNPNSIASYLKDNKGYKVFYNGINLFNKHGLVKDSLEVKDIENRLKQLEKLSDSVEILLKTKKIEVLLIDTLYSYNYIAKSYENLKNERDWADEAEDLKEEFSENSWVRLDTTISVEFVDLIKQQIDIKPTESSLDIKQFNTGYYKFINKALECKNTDFALMVRSSTNLFLMIRKIKLVIYSHMGAEVVSVENLFLLKRKTANGSMWMAIHRI